MEINRFISSEISVPVPYGTIAAKAWGEVTGKPILCLHGWLDNCGTFDRLIPMLPKDFYFVTVDAPGHGMSSHKPPGCVYSGLEMVIDFKRVVDYLGWEKFSIMGHSMGGSLSILFASLFPDLVDKVVSLDATKPSSRPLTSFPGTTIKTLQRILEIEKKLARSPPVYSVKAAAERLKKGMYDEITLESAEVLIKRGTKVSQCGSGVVFTRDLRCRTLEEMSRTSHEVTMQCISNMSCELLMILANNTSPMYQTRTPEVVNSFLDIYKSNCKKFVLKRVDGNHFVHLNDPEIVAPIVSEFLLS